MNFKEAEAYLFSLKHHGAKYGIDRMRVLMDRIDHPDRALKVIHVAGTNGKGSVCAMLESIYRQAGYKTGLFTSPHLVCVRERIKVDSKPVEEDELIRYVEWLKTIVDEVSAVDSDNRASFFEFINAIAFQFFKDRDVDIAIVETGLGGEKDSTNVVDPVATVITSISWDHSEILGESLALIAKAKAGIIKNGKPLVLGSLSGDGLSVVESTAQAKEAVVHKVEERFRGEYPKVGLSGGYQKKNAGIAQLVSEVLNEVLPVSKEEISQGLMNVVWLGRFQELELDSGSKVILDVAHNEEGAKVLVENLRARFGGDGEKLNVILGATTVERGEALIRCLAPFTERFIFVKARHPGGVSGEDLLKLVPEGKEKNCIFLEISDLRSFFDNSRGDSLLVTGSTYLLGDVFKLLNISEL